ncbi:MAG: hypothetical protein P4N41_19545 [Negativicutes bacterium]|nr:hypothetical protein [Negativicutes bacterium]MDR3591856.1 hypothetical protein [Negativicutes bacterium]
MKPIDPYAAGKFSANPYAAKRAVLGPLAVVLDGRMDDRGLLLIKPISRCIRRHDIHELILTDEAEAKPGAVVNRIAYLGFVEIEQGGVIVEGDAVFLAGEKVGVLAGFDETHMPNHLNIVIRTETMISGSMLGARLGMKVCFEMLTGGDV